MGGRPHWTEDSNNNQFLNNSIFTHCHAKREIQKVGERQWGKWSTSVYIYSIAGRHEFNIVTTRKVHIELFNDMLFSVKKW